MLIALVYVRPCVERQKNDAADSEAICEAAERPNMRFVAVRSEARQVSAVIFRIRDVLVCQRTQLVNAIRGHLAEYGLIAPQGPFHVEQSIVLIADEHNPIWAVFELTRKLHLARCPHTYTLLLGRVAHAYGIAGPSSNFRGIHLSRKRGSSSFRVESARVLRSCQHDGA